jgi:ribosomal protein S16
MDIQTIVALLSLILGFIRILVVDVTSRTDRQSEIIETVGRMGGGQETYVNDHHKLVVMKANVREQEDPIYKIEHHTLGRFKGMTTLTLKIESDETVELSDIQTHPWVAEGSLGIMNPKMEGNELQVTFPTAKTQSVRTGVDAVGMVIDHILQYDDIEVSVIGNTPPGSPKMKSDL